MRVKVRKKANGLIPDQQVITLNIDLFCLHVYVFLPHVYLSVLCVPCEFVTAFLCFVLCVSI